MNRGAKKKGIREYMKRKKQNKYILSFVLCFTLLITSAGMAFADTTPLQNDTGYSKEMQIIKSNDKSFAQTKGTGTAAIWRTDSDNNLLHSILKEGVSHSNISIKMSNATLKTATWESSDPTIFTVTGDNNGAVITGKKSGFALLKLKVVTTDGNTLTDEAKVSVYKEFAPEATGKIISEGTVYLGASTEAAARGQAPIGQELTVLGTCGDYYYTEFPQTFAFSDSLSHKKGFILKTKVSVPPIGISLSAEKENISVGDEITLKYSLIPEFADSATVLLESSDSSIATVDAEGKVKALKPGSVMITASIEGTNLSASVPINVGIKAPTLTVPITGFTDLTLKWAKIPGATGYELQRYNGKTKKYVKIKTLAAKSTSYRNVKLSGNTTYKYRMRAYAKTGDKTVYSKYSNVKSAKTSRLYCSFKSHKRVQLKWTKVKGADGYVLYQYSKSKKKYVKIKTASKTSKAYTKTGLKASKTYYFKIRPYVLKNGKKSYLSYNKRLKLKTRETTDGYFYDQVKWKKIWSGVKITKGKASTASMNKYSIKGYRPVIKYNYSTAKNTLYIHIYAKISGKGQNKKFEYYQWRNNKYVKTGTSKYTYKQLAISGIKKYWSRSNIKGNKWDYVKGVKFKTSVVLHYKNNYKAQRYIKIKIGDMDSSAKLSGAYWHFAENTREGRRINNTYASSYLYNADDMMIHLATQHQTAVLNRGTKYCSPETKGAEAYKSVAGHELGHALGLDDGYKVGNMYRTVFTKEIGPVSKKKGIWQVANIMCSARKKAANSNDIEMALQAQGMSILDKYYSWQSYKTYRNGEWYYKKSPVIRSK